MRKSQFVFSQLSVRFTHLVAPELNQLFMLIPCSINIDADHSVVLFTQKLSQPFNPSWLSIYCSDTVFQLTAFSQMVLDEALAAMEVLLGILSTKVLSGHSFMVRFLLNSVRRCKSICRAYFQQIAAQIGLWTVRLTSLRHVLRVEILVEA